MTRLDNSRADTTYILENFHGNNLIYIYQYRFHLTCRSGRECNKFSHSFLRNNVFFIFRGFFIVPQHIWVINQKLIFRFFGFRFHNVFKF